MEYVKSLPINDTPEIFGLHDNANITFAQNETVAVLESLVKLQPKSSSGGGKSREEVSVVYLTSSNVVFNFYNYINCDK